MNCLQAECTAESNAMLHHLHDRVRRFSSQGSNACIVKQNDLVVRCEAVRDRRIPAIHVGVEVLQKEQRNRSWLAETTVGITNAFGFNELCRDRFVCVIAHRPHSNTPSISTPRFSTPFAAASKLASFMPGARSDISIALFVLAVFISRSRVSLLPLLRAFRGATSFPGHPLFDIGRTAQR